MSTAPRYAVFGQPIAHSLSPRIHALFGAELHIPVDYRAIEADRERFPAVLADFARDGGRGANVTLPLKQDAIRLATALSERAQRCGSVNTLIRDGDGWHGDSTDGNGFLRDLHARHAFGPAAKTCLLLGAGGAARAVAFALIDAGVARLAISNRTHARASMLAAAIGSSKVDVIADGGLQGAGTFDLIVHASAAGHDQASLHFPEMLIGTGTLCHDLSYGHAANAFLRWAIDAGATRIDDGLGMLIEQAAESFALWHGKQPDTSPVYSMLRGELPLLTATPS